MIAVPTSTSRTPGLSTAPGYDAASGKKIFEENCLSCHGEGGKGNQELGAPNLTDQIWLYGSDEATVVDGNLISNVNAREIQSVNVSAVAPTDKQFMLFNSTTNNWTAVSMNGDATVNDGGTVQWPARYVADMAHGVIEAADRGAAVLELGGDANPHRPPGGVHRGLVLRRQVAALVEDGQRHDAKRQVHRPQPLDLDDPSGSDPGERAARVEVEVDD